MKFILVITAILIGPGAGAGADIEIKTITFSSAKACANTALALQTEGRLGTGHYIVSSFCVRDQ